jgi:hypothetical protein
VITELRAEPSACPLLEVTPQLELPASSFHTLYASVGGGVGTLGSLLGGL